MSDKNEKAAYTGSDTEGGITSGYQMNDGVKLKVPYSFFGSIYDEDDKRAVLDAMKQDSQTMGPQVQLFQKEFAEECGVKHAFATNSCTTAMHVATQVFGITEGDEVIITPVTFIATSLVVLKEGGKPVYADIDPRTFNIDPAKIEEKVTDKTKAIYVVHYGGQMCDMDPIMEIAKKYNLYVLEDCAHAAGSKYKGKPAGSIGDIGCFSFHSLKNITTLGEGGMITTNNDRLTDSINRMRVMSITTWAPDQKEFIFGGFRSVKTGIKDYWIPSHFDVIDDEGKWGCNYRMNEAQAAVGRTQLKKLGMLIDKRRENARYITDGIKGVKGITPTYESSDCYHSYHLYTLCIEEDELGASRDNFLRVLYREEGIQCILHYQPTYHFTGLKKLYDYPDKLCPNAEKFFYRRELNLPMHPRLTRNDLDTMIQGVKNAAEKVRNSGS
ncbi:MAG: DegT/DnrJ/EryC1/StrS family aminotransferase [Spirochaetes bacterium]|nr:DegT/DnrJ/EryC1/StrS family aminotransferase [Spirochaetota bacterium]